MFFSHKTLRTPVLLFAMRRNLTDWPTARCAPNQMRSLHLLSRTVACVVSARCACLCIGAHQMCVVCLYSACVQVPYRCVSALYYRCVCTSAETITIRAYRRLPARERERSRERPPVSVEARERWLVVSSGVGVRTVRKSPRVEAAL